MCYEHNILWSKFRIISASDSQSICVLRYACATRKLLTICCLHERDFALGLSNRWNRPRVSDHGRERFLHRVARNIIGIANRKCYLHGGDSFQSRSRQASLARVSNHSAREIFTHKNLRIALQKSRPCKCGFQCRKNNYAGIKCMSRDFKKLKVLKKINLKFWKEKWQRDTITIKLMTLPGRMNLQYPWA